MGAAVLSPSAANTIEAPTFQTNLVQIAGVAFLYVEHRAACLLPLAKDMLFTAKTQNTPLSQVTVKACLSTGNLTRQRLVPPNSRETRLGDKTRRCNSESQQR
jgi:hypothetical protein